MSTPRQGPAGTGSYGEAEDQNVVAERRAQATAKVSADVPAGSILLTSRMPEEAAYNIVLDMDNVLVGGKTTSGFIIWYCQEKLLERLKRHILVVSGRVVLPEEKAEEEPEEEQQAGQV
jgi:hypothetical protein